MEENITTGEYDDDDDDHAWGVPVNMSHLASLSDVQYLSRILGPRRMGYEVKIVRHFTIFVCCQNLTNLFNGPSFEGWGISNLNIFYI